MNGANSLSNALFGESFLNATHAAYQQPMMQQSISMQEIERRRREESRRAELQRDMCEFLEYAVQFDPNLKQLFTAWQAARKLES